MDRGTVGTAGAGPDRHPRPPEDREAPAVDRAAASVDSPGPAAGAPADSAVAPEGAASPAAEGSPVGAAALEAFAAAVFPVAGEEASAAVAVEADLAADHRDSKGRPFGRPFSGHTKRNGHIYMGRTNDSGV